MTRLVGHDDQRQALEAAWRSGTPHHAWLLTGPRGVGKRTFARAASSMVLSGATSFTDGYDSDAATKLEAGSHPDFRALARSENPNTGKLRTEIVVDDVRAIGDMLSRHPSLSDWRTVIIDSACEMNRNAANALLKNLEEPPKRTVFFLVCHNPGRLLPTIRSRCRALAFRPLGDDDVRTVLAAELDGKADDALVDIARGSPGRAISYAGLDVTALMTSLTALRRAGPRDAAQLAGALASELGRKGGSARYEAFLDLVPSYLAQAAKEADPAELEAALTVWEEARDLAGMALSKALDPATIIYQLARLVSRAPNHRQAA
ncbi:hypothetical protein B5C34_12210 [Pacificimonas flava]|uniref:DNA polymerase III delta prime subunit n=2 Tax=Pacificimonas TaxID=1960290 RepID=A0A219B8R7_9SPHN|nr:MULTISPECIES: DNA polymerase III subunit delta' [Pacificimonas]MBZ6378571.1 DNA polymerase III subunit delta' [Pacificimonas aurantium]OWV34148.1 hypothetical protein B5C34_12210 [Pacificimonas flava]